MGKWEKMTDGYGNMVLGYFGKTPVAPDPEIVKIVYVLARREFVSPVLKGLLISSASGKTE